MATALTYSSSGAKTASSTKLDARVFEVMPENHTLLKEAYVAYLANGRQNLAVTKTRGLVRGGGRKPWRQKGTGRARVGSSRSPIWRSGGVVFGPTGTENYTKNMTLKAKRQALRQALSLAASDKRIIVIDDIKLKQAKTSELAGLLAKIGATRTVLLAVADKTDELVRASRNLPSTKLVQATYLNVYDTMNADCIVLTVGGMERLIERLAPGDAAKQTKGGDE